MDWKKSTIYQIYPLGFCGAPEANDGWRVNRIRKVADWIPYLKMLGVDAVYFGPLFESDRHGYDTRDYYHVDSRLGSDEDFAAVCCALHENGIQVILDGVFNHVGRGFWGFQDVQRNRESSPYRDWFHLDFNGNSSFNDGFAYEGWEGHQALVKLNLSHPDVVNHLFGAIREWVDRFGIDGLRLDVAYSLDEGFLRKLHDFAKGIDPDFFLLGEIIHGDYNRIVNVAMLDSCTNYELYKGLYSSFNDHNLFEIAYSLNHQFGPTESALYRGSHLLNFADNHDVSRIASQLTNPADLPLLYGLMFALPGIPCLYYGSEWGAPGSRTNFSDREIRPSFDAPIQNALTDFISRLSRIRRDEIALIEGGYRQIALDNRQFVFLREYEEEKVLISVNLDEKAEAVKLPSWQGAVRNLFDGSQRQIEGQLWLEPRSIGYWKAA